MHLLKLQETGKFFAQFDSYFQLLVTDKNSSIRLQTYETMAQLLDNFSYSELKEYESRILQIMLSGLSDDDEKIHARTIELLAVSGKKRLQRAQDMQENFKDFYPND
jgi:hypothetical protein